MRKTFIRQASQEDLVLIAGHLTPCDRAEVEALTGLSPLIALPSMWSPDREIYVGGLADDVATPLLVWGVDPVPDTPGVGTIWMLTTPGVAANPVEFTHALKRCWDEIHSRYEVLTNVAYAKNKQHLRFLKWLGCHFIREIPLGHKSEPFIEFVSVRNT